MSDERKSFTVRIDAELCKGCGYCKELCPKQVYEFGEEMNAAGYRYMAVAAMESCIGCRTCMMVCPDFATQVDDN